jgi:transcriptional regulator with XRE-family HTH domain
MWAHAMKREVDRGLIGSWARRARIDAGYSSAEKAADAARAAGVGLTTAYLREIESGAHRPARGLIVRLAGLYRAIPPSEEADGDRWLAEIREAVQEGVEIGLVRALSQLGLAGPQPPPRRPRPRQSPWST